MYRGPSDNARRIYQEMRQAQMDTDIERNPELHQLLMYGNAESWYSVRWDIEQGFSRDEILVEFAQYFNSRINIFAEQMRATERDAFPNIWWAIGERIGTNIRVELRDGAYVIIKILRQLDPRVVETIQDSLSYSVQNRLGWRYDLNFSDSVARLKVDITNMVEQQLPRPEDV